MSERNYKALNFDLDTRMLKQYYPGRSYRHAYRDLQCFLEERGFTHRQYSGYTSNEKMSVAEIWDLAESLQKQFFWLEKCVQKFDVTDIGSQHNLVPLFQPKKEFVLCIDDSTILIEACSKMVQNRNWVKRLLEYEKRLQKWYRADDWGLVTT